MTPCRVVDTRQTGSLPANVSKTFQVANLCGVPGPATAQAYSLNVTAIPKDTQLAYLCIWPSDEGYPGVSTLNSSFAHTIANAAIVPAGSQGAVTVLAGNNTDMLIDVNGYFSSSSSISGGAPTVVQPTLPPSVPPGTQQTFSFTFSDPNGVYNIQNMKISLATSLGGLPACTITYQSGGFSLASNNDGKDGFLGPIGSGTGGSISNSSCTVAGPTVVSSGGNQATITLPITFSTSFPALVNVYEYIADVNGLNSGWVYAGAWDPPQGPVGNCSTYSYGGYNGNPSDQGAYLTYVSTIQRLNGNEVYMYSNTGIYGPNAGLGLTHVTANAYRNGTLYNTLEGDSTTYGGGVYAAVNQSLYANGRYNLGTYQFGSSTATENMHWATSPVCSSLGYVVVPIYYQDYSQLYTALKPTIVGPNQATSVALWYLGGQPSIDGYYTNTTLYGNSNWGGPFNWSVIARADKVSLSCNSCNQTVVTSAAANHSAVPGTYDYDVLVQANTDGLPTDPFPISINAPWSVNATYLGTVQDVENGVPEQGYDSQYEYSVFDVADYQMTAPIVVHETLENCAPNAPFGQQGNQTTWCTTAVPSGGDTWFPSGPLPPGWTVGGFWDTNRPTWTDHYQVWGVNQYPAPQNPSQPLGATAVVNLTQKFFVGSPGYPTALWNIFSGMCTQTNKIQAYQDHGERQNATSPVQAGTVSGVAPACTAGTFVNP